MLAAFFIFFESPGDGERAILALVSAGNLVCED